MRTKQRMGLMTFDMSRLGRRSCLALKEALCHQESKGLMQSTAERTHNPCSVLDARKVFCFHVENHWLGASKSGGSTS